MPIDSLPPELINHIFTLLPIRDLLTITLVSRQIHTLAVCNLHHRLVCLPSTTPNYELILEAYHPSAKISTPYLSCRHLGFRNLPSDQSPPLQALRQMYSCFRPVVTEENRRRRFRMFWPGAAAPPPFDPEDIVDEDATEEIHLDDGELFSQLCVVTNVVKEGGKKGMFVKHVNVNEGVMRVFRRWLGIQAANDSSGGFRRKWEDVELKDNSFLWVNHEEDVGLRFRVVMAAAERMPLISGPDDEPPVTYTLIYDGEYILFPLLADHGLCVRLTPCPRTHCKNDKATQSCRKGRNGRAFKFWGRSFDCFITLRYV